MKCFNDPENITKVCADNSELKISITEKGKNELTQKFLNETNFSETEKEKALTNFQKILGSDVSIQKNNIKSVTCINDAQNNTDQLVLLYPHETVLENNMDTIITPIPLKKGACNSIIKNSFMNTMNVNMETFNSQFNSEIENLKKKLQR